MGEVDISAIQLNAVQCIGMTRDTGEWLLKLLDRFSVSLRLENALPVGGAGRGSVPVDWCFFI